MRRRLLLANWKLNHTVAEALAFAQHLRQHWPQGCVPYPRLDVGIAPPATCLQPLAQALAGSGVLLAGQALFDRDSGAYTGALSGPLLAEAGASYVLVGHSERRRIFGEGDKNVAAQLQAARRARLQPVLCVGEDATQRAEGHSVTVVCQQLAAALEAGADTTFVGSWVVAYEPVWAIASGHSAEPQDVGALLAAIRHWLGGHLGTKAQQNVRLLYGGSVTSANLPSLLQLPDVDGALVGGASLEATTFAQLVDHAGR